MSSPLQSLRFRRFVAEDADLLHGWLTAVGLGVPAGVDGSWASRLLEDPNILCWAAVGEEGTVGFYRLDTAPDRQAEITLIVDPAHARRGVARRMLHRALDEARDRGIAAIRAVVRDENGAALALFRGAGFQEGGSKTPGNTHLRRVLHRSRSQPLEIEP